MKEKTMGCGGVLTAFVLGLLVLAVIAAGGWVALLYAVGLALAGWPITGPAALVGLAVLIGVLTYDSHQAQHGLDQ